MITAARLRELDCDGKNCRYCAAADRIEQLDAKWRDYENNYILPVFKWADEMGIDLRALVAAGGGNCVELFFRELRERITKPEAAQRLAIEAWEWLSGTHVMIKNGNHYTAAERASKAETCLSPAVEWEEKHSKGTRSWLSDEIEEDIQERRWSAMTDDNFRKRIAEMHEEHPEVFAHSPFCEKHPSKTGPAQVATPAYRTNYDAIFGRVPVGQA